MKNLTRREFQQITGITLAFSPLFGGIACGPGETSRPDASSPEAAPAKGPLTMTLGPADVTIPPTQPEGDTWRYGLGFPFQVAAGKVGLFAGLRGKRGHDFEVGTDVILFSDLSQISAEGAIPISRNHDEKNPNSSPAGAPSIMVKYPVQGGFVPAEAKLEDGSPHPHAGTGFGLCQAIAWTADQESVFLGNEMYAYLEVYQLAYDDEGGFRMIGEERIPYGELLEGAVLSNPGLTNAIADGEDLLYTMGGGIEDGRGSGLTRWRRLDGKWRPVSWVPVTEPDGSFEPSVIRDLDGSLLFCARGGRDELGRRRLQSRVWRSQDGGESWSKIIHVEGAVGGCPITLNQAADGTPYIAANLNEVTLHPLSESARPKKDDRGIVYAAAAGREKLCFWPLNEARDALETPILVRDCVAEFGLAPSGDFWAVDHPSAMTVLLGDGQWHNVIGMRICDTAEVRNGADPVPQTGFYVEEVLSPGKPIPLWKF